MAPYLMLPPYLAFSPLGFTSTLLFSYPSLLLDCQFLGARDFIFYLLPSAEQSVGPRGSSVKGGWLSVEQYFEELRDGGLYRPNAGLQLLSSPHTGPLSFPSDACRTTFFGGNGFFDQMSFEDGKHLAVLCHGLWMLWIHSRI